MSSTPIEDAAPSASLDDLKARAAPPHPGAKPEPLGSLPGGSTFNHQVVWLLSACQLLSAGQEHVGYVVADVLAKHLLLFVYNHNVAQ
jgi:hypothetical protein